MSPYRFFLFRFRFLLCTCSFLCWILFAYKFCGLLCLAAVVSVARAIPCFPPHPRILFFRPSHSGSGILQLPNSGLLWRGSVSITHCGLCGARGPGDECVQCNPGGMPGPGDLHWGPKSSTATAPLPLCCHAPRQPCTPIPLATKRGSMVRGWF
jgi:hypothetical protein